MEQLIKITTVPIEYELKMNDAKLQRRSGTAELEISRDRGGIKIKSSPIKVNIDTFEARNSISPSAARSIAQLPDKGRTAAYQATAQFAKEGKMLLKAKLGEGAQALHSLDTQRSAPPIAEFGLGFTPTTGPEISWVGPELSIQYEMDKLTFDARIDKGDVEFIPGSIELSITQHPDLVIEYVGEPIYVPARASEIFTGIAVDTQA